MSQITKNALKVENNQSFPNNNTGYITPALLREFNVDMIDSTVNQSLYDTASAGWDNSISALNTFTASQQPSFNALNAFTQSQLTINTGVNGFTQSISANVATVSGEVDQLQTWSQSVNEIKDDGILQGYSTRLHFYGLVSASIVPNINGPIASIDILQDGTKLNTASFDAYETTINAYTASTNIRLNDIETWSGSAKISIAALNTFTASFGPVATGSLVNTASYSGTTITYTKGDGTTFTNVGIQNTASFNSYTASVNVTTASLNTFTASIAGTNAFTASQLTKDATLATYTGSNDTKWTTLGLLTGSLATTGSNTFIGTQTFTGSVIVTGSVAGNIVALTVSSSTASIDLSTGNFFTLTLTSTGSTHITATNIKAGQTANLLVTQTSSGTGSIVMGSMFKQQTGNFYSTTLSGSAKDIVTFVTFDTTNVYTANIKNLV